MLGLFEKSKKGVSGESLTYKKEDPPVVDWKRFYKKVFTLVVPLALQNLVNVGVQAADVIMLGMVSEYSLAGAAIANQVTFIMVLIIFGLTSGLTVLTSQYWGKKDLRTIEKIMAMGLKSGVFVAILFVVVSQFIPEVVLSIFTRSPEVLSEGVMYLRIISISYVFMAITMTYLFVMRSVERVIVATVIYTISLVTNITLNVILIFGVGPIPAMGVVGAAIGTVITRVLELVYILIYSKFKNKDIKIRPKYLLHSDKVLRKDFLRYAMPVLINEAIWGVAISANTAILGHLGSAAIAANSVAQVTRQLSQVVTFGLAGTTAIVLGKTLGKGKLEEARLYGAKFMKMAVIMGAVGGALILLSSPIIRANLNLGYDAQRHLQFMFIVMSYYVVAQAFNATAIVGVFRAGADTRFGVIADTCSMWFFTIPLGYIAAFVLNWPVHIVYVILMFDELIKLPLSAIHYKQKKWIKNVTREMER